MQDAGGTGLDEGGPSVTSECTVLGSSVRGPVAEQITKEMELHAPGRTQQQAMVKETSPNQTQASTHNTNIRLGGKAQNP